MMRRGWVVAVVVALAALALAGLWPSRHSQPPTPGPRPAPAPNISTSGASTSSSTTSSTTAPPTTLPGPAQINATQEPTPAQEAAQQAAIAARPAYQHLPFEGNGIIATIAGATGDRIVVDVISQYSLAGTQAGWAAFLAAWGDPGSAYIVHFHPHAGTG